MKERGENWVYGSDELYLLAGRDLPPAEQAAVRQVPGSLEEVLDNLEADHQWLLEGGVFTQDVIDTWIEYKRTEELDALRLRPHPYEFHMYYDL